MQLSPCYASWYAIGWCLLLSVIQFCVFVSGRGRTSSCCWTCFCWPCGESSYWPAASPGWATSRPTSPTQTTRPLTRLRSSPELWPFSTCLPSTSGSSSARTRWALIGRWTPCLWSGAWPTGGTSTRFSFTSDCFCCFGLACGCTQQPGPRKPMGKATITLTAGMGTVMDTVTTNTQTTLTQTPIIFSPRTEPAASQRAGLHCRPRRMWFLSPWAFWPSPFYLLQTCFSMLALW